jgi:serine palmitoyltransferase
LANGVLITKLKTLRSASLSSAKHESWHPTPALKVCITVGLTRKEIEKAGTTIRHAITKVMTKKR